MFLNKYLCFLFYIFFSFSILIADENDISDSSIDFDSIQKIIDDISELTQRHTILPYLTDGMFIATEQNHPELHGLVGGICEKLEITKPLIFIHVGSNIKKLAKKFTGGLLSDSTLNTFAYGGVIPKTNKTIGIICFGLDTLKNRNKNDLECIIAHELSHLKYNHIPIKIALNFILFSGFISLLFNNDIGNTLFSGKAFSLFALSSDLASCNFSLYDKFALSVQNFLLRIISFGFAQRIDECSCFFDECHKTGSFSVVFPGAFAFFNSWFLRLSEKRADLSAVEVLDNEDQMIQYLENLSDGSDKSNNRLMAFYEWLKKNLSLPFLGVHPTLKQRIRYLHAFDDKTS